MDDLYTLLSRVEACSVVLDLGCGRGSFAYEKCRGHVIAVDAALPPPVNRRPEATYIHADSSAIPLSDASVDVVVCHHTLEHFEDYKKTLREIRRILSPSGWFWVAVPNGYGFDDALYRFIFAGGGHVNRFEYRSLIREVETTAAVRFIQSCDLFSSFIYLRRPSAEELQHYPGRAGFLGEIPAGFLTFGVLALNALTRIADRAFGTRYSQYGWGFLFGRQSMSVDSMPSYFNVCRQCGSGHSAESLCAGHRWPRLGVGLYRCPNCGEHNVLLRPPSDLQ